MQVPFLGPMAGIRRGRGSKEGGLRPPLLWAVVERGVQGGGTRRQGGSRQRVRKQEFFGGWLSRACRRYGAREAARAGSGVCCVSGERGGGAGEVGRRQGGASSGPVLSQGGSSSGLLIMPLGMTRRAPQPAGSRRRRRDPPLRRDVQGPAAFAASRPRSLRALRVTPAARLALTQPHSARAGAGASGHGRTCRGSRGCAGRGARLVA